MRTRSGATDPLCPGVPEGGRPAQRTEQVADSPGPQEPSSMPRPQHRPRPGLCPQLWLTPWGRGAASGASSHSRATSQDAAGPQGAPSRHLDSGLLPGTWLTPGELGTEPEPHTPCKGPTTEPHASPAGPSALLPPRSTRPPLPKRGRGGLAHPRPPSPLTPVVLRPGPSRRPVVRQGTRLTLRLSGCLCVHARSMAAKRSPVPTKTASTLRISIRMRWATVVPSGLPAGEDKPDS